MRKVKRRFKVELFVDTFDLEPKLIAREVSIAINAAIESQLVDLVHVCYTKAKFERVVK